MTLHQGPADPLPAPRFNLIDEPWIPVLCMDGTRCDLGIRDTLLQADQIVEIQDGSPLVVAALHRLLLAVLYRALEGPTDGEQAKRWFAEGWPPGRVPAYLDKCRVRGRFWLHHHKHPFAQIPDFEPRTWRSWTALAAEHNADNAKVLFDHVDVSRAGPISDAKAARWILAAQTFSVSAGKSELAHTGTAPSATALIVIPVGPRLIDTLAFLLVPQNRSVLEHDRPLWERDPETVETLRASCERQVDGYADLYTWRSRSIRLRAVAEGNVTHAAFASGVDARAEHQSDPMVAYRIDEKRGRLPVQFRERGLWRDFDSLLPDPDRLAPRVIEHAVMLGRSCPQRFPRAVFVAGQANVKAKIEYWRLERFHLPQALHGDRYVRQELHDLLATAEDVQTALRQASQSFARDTLSRGARKPEKEDIRSFVDQMPAIAAYWSRLESSFHAVLRDYTEEREPDAIRWSWLKAAHAALQDSWDQFAATVDTGDAWAIRALARAERFVRQRLAALAKEMESLNPKKDPA